MNILIKETGELRSLSFIDWHDGQKYTEQLISASGERQLPAFFYSLPRGSLKTATVA